MAGSIREVGGRAWAVACDVTDEAAVAALAAACADGPGRVDILVNNAGLAGSAPLRRRRARNGTG